MTNFTKSAPAAPVDIALNQLTVGYQAQVAVQALSGEFATGSLTAVVGPNGAGKSSLLAAMAGSLKPLRGEVQISADVRARMAWLPQQSAIERSFPINTFDLVAMGLWAEAGSFQALDDAQRDRVHRALAAVRLSACAQHSIGELSVGQFQRALFARVCLQNAQVILLDEPFSAVDARTTAELLEVVTRWHSEGRTVIAVLHDLDQVRRHFKDTLLLARRCVAWGPSQETLSNANLLRAQLMSEAWDEDKNKNKNESVSEQESEAADIAEGTHNGFERTEQALAFGHAA